MDQPDPENLLFETSPFGNLDAILEHDQRAVFLYLSSQGREDSRFGTRACWVRNLIPGPYVFNEDEMKQGIPPVLPRTHCKYSDERPIPNPDHLEVVWFEEGNGAALIQPVPDSPHEFHTLAVIPPWSGLEGFHGYAEECAAENQICCPMPDNPQLFERIRRAREFWQACSQPDSHPFGDLQERELAIYKAAFGEEVQYFAIDGGNFPPRGMVTFEFEGKFIAITVGLGLCPQPIVELQRDDAHLVRRIELAICLEAPIEELAQNRMLQQFSGLAGMPWRRWAWLGPNHSCAFKSLAIILGDDVRNVRLHRDGTQPFEFPKIDLPDFRGDPVNLLWLVPFAGPVNAKS